MKRNIEDIGSFKSVLFQRSRVINIYGENHCNAMQCNALYIAQDGRFQNILFQSTTASILLQFSFREGAFFNVPGCLVQLGVKIQEIFVRVDRTKFNMFLIQFYFAC